MLPGSTALDYLALAEASRLLSAERLAPYRSLVDRGEPALTIANRLVRDGLLTPFQAKVLLKGRTQGFFLTPKYKILEHLGTGGMGRVYLCEHLILQRLVAVKVLGVGTPSEGGPLAPGVIERFYREARAVAALDHKNITRVFDVDQSRGAPFMVMEYLDGIDLHRYVTTHGPLSVVQATDYIRQAAEGLHHAHQAGLVHRDIKPSNLLLDRAGVVRILDLGLARFHVDSRRNQGVTERYDAKVILGTADFMAPEQAVDSSAVDIRADIYSLGCSLFFLLTGKMVFDVDVFAQKMMAHQTQAPPPISRYTKVPQVLEEVVTRMIAKRRTDRYQTPAEVAAALVEFATPPPGPPETKAMPRLAANAFRLGLCPPPVPASSSGSASSMSIGKNGTDFLSQSSAAIALSEARTAPHGLSVSRTGPAPASTPRVDSGVISVGPGSGSNHDTPATPRETLREPNRKRPEAEPAVPQPQRSRTLLWVAGGIGFVGIAALAGVLLSGKQPNQLQLQPTPQPIAHADPNGTENAPLVVPQGATIQGGGSSFVRPIMDHWTGLYKKQPVKYASVGSSKGIEGVIQGTLQFGCTDAPLTPAQFKQLAEKGRTVLHIPVVLGAVVPIYNLPEVGSEKLVFTGPVLADIYLGKITHWDDEAILINNPLVRDKLTHRPIVVTHRSDGSGTTFIWTDYLCASSPDWVSKAGKGTNVKWPVGKGAAKSEGVTDAVNSTIGAIGYVELSHALQLNLRYGLVKNRQGTVVPPTFENVTAAAASLGDSIPKDLIFSLVDRREGKGAEKAYPITGATWALLPIPKDGKIDPNVVDFLEWATHEGQKYATDLRYAPLPQNFSDKLDAAFYRLKRGEEP
ncbi:MAG: phosphate ABC transporter substrate-binding protein PstS [Gemmataceae bacterium]